MEKSAEKLSTNSKILISCQLMNAIIDIFLSTFLIAHILKISGENIGIVSTYYIIMYVVIAITTLLIGKALKRFNNAAIFRIGVLIKFLAILALVLLKNNLQDYILCVAPVLGIANAIYWAPCDNILPFITTDNNRAKHYSTLNILKQLLTIIVPITLGATIDLSSFYSVLNFILILTGIQVILSFWMNLSVAPTGKLRIREYLKSLKENSSRKRIDTIYKTASMYGIIINLIPTLITIIIVKTFKTNFQLGLFSTIFAITAMLAIMLFKRRYRKGKINDFLITGGMITMLSVFLLLYKFDTPEILFYYFASITFTAVLDTMFSVERHHNEANNIDEEFNTENQMLIIVLIQCGRIFGYVMLLLSTLFNNDLYFRIVLLISTVFIPIYCYQLGKLDKKE